MASSPGGKSGWRGLWILPALPAAAVAVWFALKLRTIEVAVANGLDLPVTVTVDQDRFTVAAGGRVDRALRAGPHHFAVATAAGTALGTDDVDLPSGTTAAIYNVLSVAPLFSTEAVYSAVPGNDDTLPTPHVGHRWILFQREIDDRFTDPPKQVKVQHGQTTRRYVLMMPNGGWRTTVQWLVGNQRAAEAVTIATTAVLAGPDDPLAYRTAAGVAVMAGGTEGMAAFGRQLIAARPESVEAHRLYQTSMDTTERRPECRAEYERRFAATPTATNAYLWARMERGEKTLKLWRDLSVRFPDGAYLRRGLGWELLRHHLPAEALAELERSATLDPGSAGQLLEARVRALVQLQRAPDALRLIEAEATRAGGLDWHEALIYAQVSRIVDPSARADRYFTAENEILYTSMVADQEVTDQALKVVTQPAVAAALRIDSVLPRDVDRGLELVRQAPEGTFGVMSMESVLLAAGELQRRGEVTMADAVLKACTSMPDADVVRRLIMSGSGSVDELELPEQRAALYLARARAATTAADRNRFSAAVRTEDVLRGPITRALEHWARPGEHAAPPPATGTAASAPSTATSKVSKDVLREMLQAR